LESTQAILYNFLDLYMIFNQVCFLFYPNLLKNNVFQKRFYALIVQVYFNPQFFSKMTIEKTLIWKTKKI